MFAIKEFKDNLARKKHVEAFVYVSSMEVYGVFSNLGRDVTEEDMGFIDPLSVRSNYPESKRLCENMCVAYYQEYAVPVRIARLAQTFGAGILPGENRVFAQFVRSVMNGNDCIAHTGKIRRELLLYHGCCTGTACYCVERDGWGSL